MALIARQPFLLNGVEVKAGDAINPTNVPAQNLEAMLKVGQVFQSHGEASPATRTELETHARDVVAVEKRKRQLQRPVDRKRLRKQKRQR